MKITPDQESTSRVYSTMIRAITPRPIAWVSTVSDQGISNLAPFSYFNGVGSKPAALTFSVVNKPDGSKKDTIRNIEANQQFVVNVVPFGLAEKMGKTAAEFEYEESEFAAAGLTEKPSQTVTPPGVAESPIQFECQLIQIVNIGEGPAAANLVIGQIQLIDIDDAVLTEDGKIDPAKLDAVGRLGGMEYCRTTHRFSLPRG